MSKILVTGSNGQIGKELIDSLITTYGRANVLGLDITEADNPDLHFHKISVTDQAAMAEVVKTNNVKEIYHLAAILSANGEQNPAIAWDVNINGIRNVLEIARQHNCRVFWPSTIAVFGEGISRDNTSQYSPLVPSTIYGITKVSGENLCHYYHTRYGVDVRSVRFPGLISYKAPPGGGTTDYAVAIFFDAVLKAEYQSFVKADTVLPMMYMDDALRAIHMIMDAPADQIKIRTSYNLAALSFSVQQLADQISNHMPLKVSYQPDFRQAIADSWPRSINDQPARSDWGWTHHYDLAKLVESMIQGVRQSYVKK